MELSDLIEICRAWDAMGWAVQGQLEAVVDGEPLEDQNPNAMEIAQGWLDLVRSKAEWVGDSELRGQAVDLFDRIDRGAMVAA